MLTGQPVTWRRYAPLLRTTSLGTRPATGKENCPPHSLHGPETSTPHDVVLHALHCTACTQCWLAMHCWNVVSGHMFLTCRTIIKLSLTTVPKVGAFFDRCLCFVSIFKLIFSALELEPTYLKAILRRAQASETLEKYEDALNGVLRCVHVQHVVSSDMTLAQRSVTSVKNARLDPSPNWAFLTLRKLQCHILNYRL